MLAIFFFSPTLVFPFVNIVHASYALHKNSPFNITRNSLNLHLLYSIALMSPSSNYFSSEHVRSLCSLLGIVSL